MAKKHKARPVTPKLGKKEYEHALRRLQIELVKLHHHVIAHDLKILVILEGRDSAGKDGTIKRIVEHLSPREARVVAPGKPSDREETEWYFQRYVRYLPAAQEIVLFKAVPHFERLLVRSGTFILKYYLDISHEEQAQRLRERRKDPLKQWKISPVDDAAQAHWKDYSRARDSMLLRTHTEDAPWIVVRADDKQQTRLNVIRDLLMRIPGRAERRREQPDARVVREFRKSLITKGWLAA